MADTDISTEQLPAIPAPQPWEPGWLEWAQAQGNPQTPIDHPDSATVSGVKAAAASVTPAAGALAGAETGAAAGALVPGLGETGISELVGGFVGAVVGGVAASKAQNAALKKFAPDTLNQLATNEEAHPIASTIGSIAAALPMFEFNPGQTVKGVASLWKMSQGMALDKAGKDAAMALAVQSGMGVAGGVASPLVEGQAPTLKDIGINTLQALILGKPRFDIFKVSETLGLPTPKQPAAEGAPETPPSTDGGSSVEAGGNVPVPPAPSPVPAPEATYAAPPMTDAQKANVTSVVARETGGEDSASLHADLAAVQSDPQQNALYTLAKRDAVDQKKVVAATQMAHQEIKPALSADEQAQAQKDLEASQEEPTPPSKPATSPSKATDAVRMAPEDVAKQVGELRYDGVQPGNPGKGIADRWNFTYQKDGIQSTLMIPADTADPVAALAAKKQAFIDSVPSWRKAMAPPEAILGRVEDSEAQLKRQQVEGSTAGMKRAQMYEETKDPDVIYADSRAGKNRSETRKLVAMASPDKSHVAVGTAFETPTAGKLIRRVTSYDDAGKPVTRKFDDLVKEGWEPVATIKTKDSLKNYVATYSSDGWAKLAGSLRELEGARGRAAAAMEQHLEASKEFGREQPEEQPEHGDEEAASPEAIPPASDVIDHFTQEHADAIYDVIHAAEVENGRDVIDAIRKGGLVLELESAMRDSGLLAKIKTLADAKKLALEWADQVYAQYKSQPKRETFSAALTDSVLRSHTEGGAAAPAEAGSAAAAATGSNAGGTGAASPGAGPAANPTATNPDAGIKVFRGEGRDDKTSIYSKGINQPILGAGKYYAFDKETASKFGPNVKSETVTPKNPLIIKSDADYSNFTRAAGIRFPKFWQTDPKLVKSAIADAASKIKDYLAKNGYDAVIVQGTKEFANRNLSEAFGHDQVFIPEIKTTAAERVAAAANRTDVNPTDTQKQTGRYQKGRVELDGLDIAIENPLGSIRSGKDAGGKEWSVKMPVDYGEIVGHEGRDGDHLDVFIGPHPDTYENAYIIDQVDPKTGKFDEHKTLIGFDSKDQAVNAYKQSFSDGQGDKRVGAVTEMPREEFHDWVHEADLKKPLAYGKTVRTRQQTEESERRTAQILKESRMSRDDVLRVATHLVDNLRILGIDTKMVAPAFQQMVKDAGKYEEWQNARKDIGRAITICTADAEHPTADNLMALWHEAAHAVFAKETPERQAMLHAAISDATNQALGIGRFVEMEGGRPAEGQTQQEGRLAETMATALTRQGFDPGEAASVSQRVLRAVIDLYHRVLMGVQQMLGVPISHERATAYFENRMKLAMSGDAAQGFVSFLGGPRVATPAWSGSDYVGAMLRLTKERDPNFVTDATAEVSPDQNSTALNEHRVAAENWTHDTLTKMYQNWTEQGYNTANIQFDDWLKSGSFIKMPGPTPQEAIALVNDALLKVQQQPIKPDMKFDEVTSEVRAKQGMAMAHRMGNTIEAELRARRVEAEKRLKTNSNALAGNNERHTKVLKDYTDLDMVTSQARLRMQEAIQAEADAAKGIRALSGKDAVLGQVIRQLDTSIKGEDLPRSYESALNKLYTRLSGGEGDFADMLQHVASLNLDWKAPASELKEQLSLAFKGENGHLLEPLLQSTPESRALLATAITFGKSNSHMMDLLQLRRTDAIKERAAANDALRLAMQPHSTANQDARTMAQKLRKLGPIVDRLVQKLGELKARNHDLIDEIGRDRAFIDFHQAEAPVLRGEMARLESKIGITKFDFEPVDGAKVYAPPKPTSSPDEVELTPATLNMKADGTTSAQVADILRKQSDWLKANTPETAGATWNAVKMQHDKLMLHQIQWGIHQGIVGSFVNRFIAPMTDKARLVGTPLARSIATRIDRSQTLWRSVMTKTHENGARYEAAEARAMTALGIQRPDVFRRTVLRSFANFLEHNQQLLAGFKNDKEAIEAGVRAGMQHLRTDPQTAAMMEKPGAAELVDKYLRVTTENADFIGKNAQWMGLKVADQTPGYSFYRDLLGLSPYTMPRSISDQADAMFLRMKAWLADPMDAGKIAEAYKNDPKALQESLAEKFTPEVWDTFVRQIANRTGRAAFYAPKGEDGIEVFAMRERVMKAFENSKDPITFAENLFRLEGGQGGRDKAAAFIGETMDTFQNYFELLRGMRGDDANNVDIGLPTPKRWIMDSRKSEEAPAEWYDYLPYDKTTIAQVTRTQAYQAAFGRNMAAMRNTLGAALKEQQDMAQHWTDLAANHPELTGKDLRKAIRADLVKEGANVVAHQEAARNAKTIAGVQKNFEALLTMNRDRPPEMNAWQELLGAVAGMTVSGPATAITAHEVFLEQPFRKFGFNAAGLKFFTGQLKDTAGIAFGSLAQAFRLSIAQDAWHIRQANAAGIYDDDATLAVKDKWKSAFVHSIKSDSTIFRGAVIGGRLAKTALTVGVGHQLEGKPSLPTLKPLSAFHWMAQVIQLGTFIRWSKTYESMVSQAAEHFKANPEHMADPAFKFAAKDLGHEAGRTWDYLNESMNRFGMSFEELARDAVTRREKDELAPLLESMTYRHIAQQALNESTLESSLTTRMPAFSTTPLGQAMNPMLGWAIQKSYDAWRGFREPNGMKSMNAFRTGLLAYAAILPIGMAFALLRNKFDEDVLGRKQNVSDLTTMRLDDPQDAFLTVLDNAARVGTFGIAGEIPNYWLNQDNSRPLSVDSRVFFVSTLLNAQRGIMNMIHQRSMDYQTVVRPLMQSLGGNGYFQYAGLINHTMGLDDAEARVEARISVNNYLRVAGRDQNVEVRTYQGMAQTAGTANPLRPLVGQMILAAYANDSNGFNDARKEAVLKAKEDGMKPDEALKKITQMYEDASPLRVVFKSLPSQTEYNKMLATMDEQGRTAVATAVRLYQHYGVMIGATASTFGRGTTTTQQVATTSGNGYSGRRTTGDSTIDSMLSRMRAQPTF